MLCLRCNNYSVNKYSKHELRGDKSPAAFQLQITHKNGP